MARILVVDDYAPLLVLLETILRAEGHEVRVAADGAEGLASARRELPHLVLLDVDMPGLDGISVCALLKGDAATMQAPVLLMSGRLSPHVLVRAREAGAAGALPKPFSREVLMEEIARALSAGTQARCWQ